MLPKPVETGAKLLAEATPEWAGGATSKALVAVRIGVFLSSILGVIATAASSVSDSMRLADAAADVHHVRFLLADAAFELQARLHQIGTQQQRRHNAAAAARHCTASDPAPGLGSERERGRARDDELRYEQQYALLGATRSKTGRRFCTRRDGRKRRSSSDRLVFACDLVQVRAAGDPLPLRAVSGARTHCGAGAAAGRAGGGPYRRFRCRRRSP